MEASSIDRITQYVQRGFCASLLLTALAFGTAGSAQAALLNLMPDTPDITSAFINVDYNGGTDLLTASGTALSLDDDGVLPALNIVGGSFDLNATIDAAGILSGGTISIGGTIAGIGAISGILLTGELTDVGFSDTGGDPLEFLFDVTGGDLSSLYGGTGGIILTSSGFQNWVDFQNFAFSGVSDTFAVSPIPVPAAVWLFGSALLGLAGFGRHSRRKQA